MENTVERTLVLVKPHVLYAKDWSNTARSAVEDILDRYKQAGLFPGQNKIFILTKEMVRQLYQEHVDKPFFPELVKEMVASGCLAIVLLGENAVQKVREINGATDPDKAASGTIRHKYGLHGPQNAVHGSDSVESAEREIKIIFG